MKKTSMEDAFNRRQTQQKTKAIEDVQNGDDPNGVQPHWRGPHWKKTSTEEDLKERQPQ